MMIRPSTLEDLPEMLEIYAYARKKMAENGNPRQWGPTHWPPEELLREDIALGRSFVCVEGEEESREADGTPGKEAGPGEKILGTFCYIYGPKVDPTYDVIEEGDWTLDAPYGAAHRIAAAEGTRGVGSFIVNQALQKAGYLRIDTHPDNKIMQGMLAKNGFRKCGIIHVAEDNDPRFAYDRVL